MTGKAYKVGDLLTDVKTVTRPDGGNVTVAGGLYVLTQAGKYVINGNEVTVK